MRKFIFVLFLMVSQLTTIGVASAKPVSDKVLEKLKNARPDFKFGDVSSTPIKGIYKSSIVNGPTIYLTGDGKYFFAGDFFEVGDKGLVNLGEKEMEQERVVALSKLSLNDLVIFAPEKTKAYVYVFTDVDCYYCQKLHQEMTAINELGIEVRYLAYPRAGIGSPSYRKIASAWCADSPTESLTKLKNGEDIPDDVCEPNPVGEHFRIGGKLGVAGTPALVTADGELLPGYMPADKLAAALGL